MTYLVAFDGGPLSRSALRRADEFSEMNGERVVVVIVVPTDKQLAEQYGLLEGETYDPKAAAGRLREAALELTPDAEIRIEHVDRYAGKGQIASKIRQAAREEDADLVFVGSKNAGRVIVPVASVAGSVATDSDYDVYIVRSP